MIAGAPVVDQTGERGGAQFVLGRDRVVARAALNALLFDAVYEFVDLQYPDTGPAPGLFQQPRRNPWIPASSNSSTRLNMVSGGLPLAFGETQFRVGNRVVGGRGLFGAAEYGIGPLPGPVFERAVGLCHAQHAFAEQGERPFARERDCAAAQTGGLVEEGLLVAARQFVQQLQIEIVGHLRRDLQRQRLRVDPATELVEPLARARAQ